MSWVMVAIGGAQTVAGLYGADAKRKGARGQADEYGRVARDTLLTAKYNIRKREDESKQKQFSTYEQGARALNQVAVEGQKQQGRIIAESSGSGAVVSSGTTLDVIMTEAVNNTVQQLSVVDATKDAMQAEARATKNANEAEWRNAKNRSAQLDRKAEMTKKAAQDAYTAEVLSSIVSGASTAASGFKGSSPKTPTSSISANDASMKSMHSTPKSTNWFSNAWHNVQYADFMPSKGFMSIGNKKYNKQN